MLYNPLKEKITSTIKVPLYYTGATGTILISEQDGNKIQKKLDRKYEIELTINIGAESYTYFVIE